MLEIFFLCLLLVFRVFMVLIFLMFSSHVIKSFSFVAFGILILRSGFPQSKTTKMTIMFFSIISVVFFFYIKFLNLNCILIQGGRQYFTYSVTTMNWLFNHTLIMTAVFFLVSKYLTSLITINNFSFGVFDTIITSCTITIYSFFA